MILEAVKSKICRIENAVEPKAGVPVPVPWPSNVKNSLLLREWRVSLLSCSSLQLIAQGSLTL